MVSHEDSEAWSVAIELHSDPEAEEKLVGAILTASETNHQELEAEARAALGIYYAHHGRIPDAMAHLERSLELMKQTPGPNREAALHYLGQIERGQIPFPGPGPGTGTAEAIRSFVLERLPAGLISQLGVHISAEGGVRWEVEVSRPMSDAEARLLHDTIDAALDRFQPKG
ncbi:MAG: hypothetical protein KGS60_17620 [Verrucomicrobia bacterium]|nr:hypothetical protein [Verrucomicrobiota bacterium]